MPVLIINAEDLEASTTQVLETLYRDVQAKGHALQLVESTSPCWVRLAAEDATNAWHPSIPKPHRRFAAHMLSAHLYSRSHPPVKTPVKTAAAVGAAPAAAGAATSSKAQLKEENKRLSEENKSLEQQLRKRPREQPASQSQISSYFLPRSNQGSFPWDPLVGSPTVKTKSSPSAIMGAGFIPDY